MTHLIIPKKKPYIKTWSVWSLLQLSHVYRHHVRSIFACYSAWNIFDAACPVKDLLQKDFSVSI